MEGKHGPNRTSKRLAKTMHVALELEEPRARCSWGETWCGYDQLGRVGLDDIRSLNSKIRGLNQINTLYIFIDFQSY